MNTTKTLKQHAVLFASLALVLCALPSGGCGRSRAEKRFWAEETRRAQEEEKRMKAERLREEERTQKHKAELEADRRRREKNIRQREAEKQENRRQLELAKEAERSKNEADMKRFADSIFAHVSLQPDIVLSPRARKHIDPEKVKLIGKNLAELSPLIHSRDWLALVKWYNPQEHYQSFADLDNAAVDSMTFRRLIEDEEFFFFVPVSHSCVATNSTPDTVPAINVQGMSEVFSKRLNDSVKRLREKKDKCGANYLDDVIFDLQSGLDERDTSRQGWAMYQQQSQRLLAYAKAERVKIAVDEEDTRKRELWPTLLYLYSIDHRVYIASTGSRAHPDKTGYLCPYRLEYGNVLLHLDRLQPGEKNFSELDYILDSSVNTQGPNAILDAEHERLLDKVDLGELTEQEAYQQLLKRRDAEWNKIKTRIMALE